MHRAIFLKILGSLALMFSTNPLTALAAAPSRPVLRDHLLSLLAENRSAAAETGTDPVNPAEERHARHRKKLRSILETHGWPGSDLVGEDGSEAALVLLQEECTDGDLMKLAIPLLHAAVQRRMASLADLARLIDAARVGSRRMQLYGTQYRAAADGQPVRFPLEDPAQVDARRQLMGLPSLRSQEEEMGLLAPRAVTTNRSRAESIRYWNTRLQTARGLNSVRYPRLRMIYVHSRDDPRAPAGERYAVPGLDMKKLPVPGPDKR